MVQFTFNTYGFAFEKGVEQLIDAFRLAGGALEANRRNLEDELASYEAAVADGRGVIGEWEDDHWLWTQDQLLAIQIEDAADSLKLLREAFVVALYHHWERGVRRQFKTDKRSHKDLVRLAEKGGLSMDPRLSGVRDLANLLKHSNRKRGLDLLASWPELLPSHFTPETKGDWYEAVILTDTTVQVVAEIIKASGPRINKSYAT